MKIVENAILLCYMVAIFLSIGSITMIFLSGKKKKTELNGALKYFIIVLLIMSLYDMLIYYTGYVIGGMTNTFVLRIGSCIIAILFYLWINLQQKIIGEKTFAFFNKNVKIYVIVYASLWCISSFVLSIKYFYTLRWLLLVTDVVLILLLLVGSVIYMSRGVLLQKKNEMRYMLVVTAMLLWNYGSFFWGEASVYWGNSRFIREPLDLTIIFWFIVNLANVYFIYKVDFSEVYKEEPKAFDLDLRMDELAREYDLTTREKDLVVLIYRGKSNSEIAAELYISESTVKTHIYNIFKKLNIKNRGGVNGIIHKENG
ncbi:MAG: response regulator transcription factor [Anaerovoracaceae bacterium]